MNNKIMNTIDYSVFEFDQNFLPFYERFFYKKWKALIRSELEKKYPNFNSFTMWQIKGLYNPFSKRIIVIVVEPEIFSRYRTKFKSITIEYKGKKYKISFGQIKFFLSFCFFLLLLFSLISFKQNIRNPFYANEAVVSDLLFDDTSYSYENGKNNYKYQSNNEQKKVLSLFYAVDILKEANTDAQLRKIKWFRDEVEREHLEVLVTNIYPEEIKTIFQKKSLMDVSFEISSIEYAQNVSQLLLQSETFTEDVSIQESDLFALRKIIQDAGGFILREKHDSSSISFEIPKQNFKQFELLATKISIAVTYFEIEVCSECIVITLHPSFVGINVMKILSYFTQFSKSENLNVNTSIVKQKVQNDLILLGSVIEEGGTVHQYFKTLDNKIVVGGN